MCTSAGFTIFFFSFHSLGWLIIFWMLFTMLAPLVGPAFFGNVQGASASRYKKWMQFSQLNFRDILSINATMIIGTLIFLTVSNLGTNIVLSGLFDPDYFFSIPTTSLINALAALIIIPFSASSILLLLWGPDVRSTIKKKFPVKTTDPKQWIKGELIDEHDIPVNDDNSPLKSEGLNGVKIGTMYTIAGFVWIITSMAVIISLAVVPEAPNFPSLPTTLEVDATDENGANVTYPVPTALDSEGSRNNTVICNPRSGDKFPVGETMVKCTATDKEGRKGSGNLMVVVMDDPPDTIIKHAIIGDNNTDVVNMTVVPYTSSDSIYFEFEGQDKFGTKYFECRRYTQNNKTASFLPCEGPQSQSYDNLSPGIHTFQVRAVDASPQQDITPARFTWVITNPT